MYRVNGVSMPGAGIGVLAVFVSAVGSKIGWFELSAAWIVGIGVGTWVLVDGVCLIQMASKKSPDQNK